MNRISKWLTLLLGFVLLATTATGATTKLQNFQIVQDSVMDKVKLPNRSTNQDIMVNINKALDVPLRLYTDTTANALLYIGPNKVEGGDGAGISTSPADDQINSFSTATIDFANRSVSGGTLKSSGGTFAFAACTVGQFRRLVFKYNSASNWVDSVFSPQNAVEASLENVGATFSALDGTPIGYIELECTNALGSYKTIGSATAIIEPKVGSTFRIFRFGSGSGSGAGGDTSFKLQSISSNVGTLKKGEIVLDDGRILRLSSDTSFNLKTAVNTFGVTAPANSTTYWLYVDLTLLPAVSTAGNALHNVYIPASGTAGAFIVLAGAPDVVNQVRYLPLAAIRTDGSGNYTLLDNGPLRRHQTPSVAVNPMVYSDLSHSVGTVGAAQVTQGGLTDADFPSMTGVTYWSLAGDSLAKNTGGNVFNLTQVGTPTFLSKGFFGRTNSILLPGAVGTYLTNTANSALNPPPASGYTFGGWFYLNANTAAAQYLIANDQVGSGGFSMSFNTNATISIQTRNVGGNVNSASTAAWTPGWNHIVGQVASATLNRLYINGKLVATSTAGATALAAGTSTFRVGISSQTDFPFLGSIQDVFMAAGQVLTEAQINNLYSKRFTGKQLAGGHILDSDSFPIVNTNVSWYGLSSGLTDGNTLNTRPLTNSTSASGCNSGGTAGFTAANIFGAVNSAVLLNGTSNSLCSTDPFFNAGNTDFVTGGWFYSTNWSVQQMLFSQWNLDGSDPGFLIQSNLNTLVLTVATSGSTFATVASYPIAGLSGWHHVAVRYSPVGFRFDIILDGVVVASGNNSIAMRTLSTPYFKIGAYNVVPAVFFSGAVQDFFYIKSVTSNEDITKLAAARIDLPATAQLPSARSLWNATFRREDGSLVNEYDKNWLIDKSKPAKLYINPSVVSDGATLDLQLFDTGLSARTVPARTFDQLFLSTPGATIAHGLPDVPTFFSVMHNELADGRYAPLWPGNYIKADGTNLYTSGMGGLTIDATRPLRVIASVGAGALSIPRTERYISSNVTAATNDLMYVDTSAARTITFPASPGFGDRITVQDVTGSAGTNNITISRNGQPIESVAEDYVIDINKAWVEFVYINSTRGWAIKR